MIAAVFFPAQPDALVFDLVAQAQQARRAGLKLYTNGRQFALLPRAFPGWAIWGTK